MQRSADETTPVWTEHAQPEPRFDPLQQSTEADVCVVGAGIAGLTTAYLLQKAGRSVVVADAFGLAAGETGRTTAHLSAVLDDRFSELEKLFGVAGSRLAADSHRAAIDRIESIVAEERIDCDFERVNGYLVGLPKRQHRAWDKEIDAAQRAGFYDSEGHPRVPLANVHAEMGPALEFPRQATFHPRNYMIGLAKAFMASGGRIHGRTRVAEVLGGPDAHAMTEDGHRIDARHIVVATNTPVNDRVTMHTKQAAYRSYAIALDVPKDSYPGFLLWDMEDPYHYVRLMRGGEQEFLIVGGDDHKTGQASDMEGRYRRLEEWTRRYFGAPGAVKYRWSGQIIEPVDSLAFIGRNPGEENVYITTGDSGHGMTHGTIAGMLISDLVQGRQNPWAELYDPARIHPRAARSFASENLNAGAHLAKDWLGPGEVETVERVGRGEGAISTTAL
jgi:glycine/D-amino acid oxidase-like deaminating enzyme